MARKRARPPPPAKRRSRWDAASEMPAGRRKADPASGCMMSMDVVLLDPQRLYDATLCSQDEFDYILYLYEGWLGRKRLYSLFRSETEDGQPNPGYIYPRHALLMLLADKKGNVPMEMLADLFGTDIDGVSRYLSITDRAIIDALSLPATGVSEDDLAAGGLFNIDINVPMVSIDDPIRPRTAKNYPGLLPSKQTVHGAAIREDADAARQRVENARIARVALGLETRLMQYRRLTDPYTGYPGLETEAAVIGRLENLHLKWDQIRQNNRSLLVTLAQKRDLWGRA